MIVKISIVLALFILLFVIEMIRQEKLTFKYAFAWIAATLGAVLFAVQKHWVFELAHFFGFELPSNFIFFSILAIFVLIALLMTIFLCQQNSRNDTIAQKISVMQYEIDQLKREKRSNKD